MVVHRHRGTLDVVLADDVLVELLLHLLGRRQRAESEARLLRVVVAATGNRPPAPCRPSTHRERGADALAVREDLAGATQHQFGVSASSTWSAATSTAGTRTLRAAAAAAAAVAAAAADAEHRRRWAVAGGRRPPRAAEVAAPRRATGRSRRTASRREERAASISRGLRHPSFARRPANSRRSIAARGAQVALAAISAAEFLVGRPRIAPWRPTRSPPRPPRGHAPARHRERPHATRTSGCRPTRSRRAASTLPGVPGVVAQSPTIDTLEDAPVARRRVAPPSRAPPYGSKPRWAAADVPPPRVDAFTSPAKAAAAPAPASPAARRSRARSPRTCRTSAAPPSASASPTPPPPAGRSRRAPPRSRCAAAPRSAPRSLPPATTTPARLRRGGRRATRRDREAAPTEPVPEPSEPPPPPGTPPTPDGHVADAEDDDDVDDDFDDDDDDDAAAAPPRPPPPLPPHRRRRCCGAAVGTRRFAFGGGATARLANEYIAAAQPASPGRARAAGGGGEWVRRAIDAVVRAAAHFRALRAPSACASSTSSATPTPAARGWTRSASLRPAASIPACATTLRRRRGDGAVCRPRYFSAGCEAFADGPKSAGCRLSRAARRRPRARVSSSEPRQGWPARTTARRPALSDVIPERIYKITIASGTALTADACKTWSSARCTTRRPGSTCRP